MSAEGFATVDLVLKGLATLSPFSYQVYVQGIKNVLSVDTTHWNTPCTSSVYGEDPGGNNSVVNGFKVETIALGVSRSTGYGFSDCVDHIGLSNELIGSASQMVVPVYRQYLEDHLAISGNKLSILTLITEADFCQAFVTATLTSLPADRVIYDSVAKTNLPIASIAMSSLPQINIFARTTQASQKLSQAGQTQNFLTSALPIKWSNNQLLQGPSFESLGAVWAGDWVTDTYATDVANSLIGVKIYETYNSPDPEGGGAVTYVTYGDALWKWMQNQQNNGCSDIFQVKGNENSSYVNPFSGSCISPQTVIATASGDRPIHSLGANDKILIRAAQEFGILSDEKVQQDITPAIQPGVARLENSRIHVGKLVEGDFLLKLNKGKTDYDQIEIKSITCEPAKCNTVHGLHFARGGSGGGRYHANGYWVGENYPEITIQALQSRFEKMNHVDQHAFRRQVQNLPDIFEKVFGLVVHNAFQQNFALPARISPEKPVTDRLAAVEKAGAKHVSVRDITANFKLVHATMLTKSQTSLDTTSPRYKDLIKETNGPSAFPEISLSNGAVIVDGVLVTHASMSHLSVQWSHELPGQPGMYQHGVLRSIGHGKAITGYIGKGASDAATLQEIESFEPFIALADANDYALTSSPQTYPSIVDAEAASPAPGQTWNTFWKIEIGLTMQVGGLNVQVTMPDLDAEWNRLHPNSDTSLYAVSSFNFNAQDSILIVPVAATQGLESYLQSTIQGWGNSSVKSGPAFKSFTLLLNLISNAVHGYYTELMEDPSGGYEDGPLHATYSPDSYSLKALHTATINAITKSQRLGAPEKNANVHDPTANLHQPALPATQALSSRLFSAPVLSISDLQTTPAPSDSDMNAKAQTYMQHAGSYWRAQPEVDVFGDEKKSLRDALPDSLTDGLYSGGQAFLGTYSRGMIMQSLSTQDTYSKRFSDKDQDTLGYFWQGSQDGCLAQNTDFNKVTKIAASASFLSQTPGLQAYVEDSQDWANLFFTFLTTDAQITNQALAMFASGTNNLTNRYCMILSALDTQNRDYDVKLWKAVRDKLLMRPSTGTIHDDKNEWPAFAEQFAAQLILQIQSGTGTDLLTELNIDLKQLEDAFGTKSAAEMASQLYNSTSDLGRCFVQAIQEIGKLSSGGLASLADLMSKVTDKVSTSYPSLAKAMPYIQGITAITLQGFSIYASVTFLMNWGTLSDADRANAILSIVNSVALIFKDVGSLIAKLRNAEPGSFDYQIACVEWNKTVGQESPKAMDQEKGSGGEIEMTPILDEKELAAVNSAEEGASLDEQMAASVADPALAGQAAKTFSLAETVAGAIAVAANVATAVCIGFQIANDFETDQPAGIKTLDILSEVATSAQVITGALEIGFAVAGVECAAVPVVGAVVALIGIVLMFVEMFVPHKPPEDPVQKYLDDQKDVFISPLPPKPQPLLTYDVTSKVPLSQQGILTINVTDPKNTGTLIKSLLVRFTAGADDASLFINPTGSDAKANPTTNIVTYAIGGGRTDFTIAGGKTAAVSDNSMMAKVYSSNADGFAIGPSGLSITITGSVNAQAGTAVVKVSEGAASRPDKVAATDVYQYFNISKA